MAWLVYYLLMYLMVTGIKIKSMWDKKAAQWIAGRKHWIKDLQSLPAKKYTRIWFHVSSLGEFEQARPVIEKLKAKDKNIDIILTFFSPSGYEIRSGYQHATVFYLPADLPGHPSKWLELVNPDLAVFVKYDLWPGYLQALAKRNIPALLISAHWKRGSWFSSWRLPPTSTLLPGFKQIFLQHAEDLVYFKKKGFSNLNVAGDTRIDRSLELAEEAVSKIPHSLKEMPAFDVVAGSTWPADEQHLAEALVNLNLRLLVAPHDVSEKNISRLMQSFPTSAKRLSTLKPESEHPQVIVIDSIGLLAFLYPLGRIAYIGGGFGSGIHNTLEPMAYGKPLIFGPAYKKFPEAEAMVHEKAAISIRNASELEAGIRYYNSNDNATKSGKLAYQYLIDHKGASNKVFQYIIDSVSIKPVL